MSEPESSEARRQHSCDVAFRTDGHGSPSPTYWALPVTPGLEHTEVIQQSLGANPVHSEACRELTAHESGLAHQAVLKAKGPAWSVHLWAGVLHCQGG